VARRWKYLFASLRNGDGRLKELYPGYKENLEELLSAGKDERNTGKDF
jgi:hypothetical protein